MKNKNIHITKKFEFSASHRYWKDNWSEEKNQEIFGLCTGQYGHGHNYELHVTISGKVDPKTGMIINLSDLKKYVNEIVELFDHRFLNLDTPYFKEKIPTTGLLLNTITNQIMNNRERQLWTSIVKSGFINKSLRVIPIPFL